MSTTNIEIGLSAAIVGVVYSVVLSSDYTPLNGWFLMLAIMRDRSGPISWIGSLLGGCEKCFSGQIALWYSVLTRPSESMSDISMHIVAACIAVLSAAYIGHAYRWLKRRI
jgi:hypothetical protein